MGRCTQDKYWLLNTLWLAVVFSALLSCNTTKYLDEDEALLKKNEVVLQSKAPIKDKLTLKSNLESAIVQEPNSRYFGIKREWLYQKVTEREEDFWLKDWLTNQSEPPAIYDSTETRESIRQIRNYMFNRGYFDARVDHDIELKKKKAYSTYFVKPREPYTIDELNYFSGDYGIVNLLDSLEESSLLRTGALIDNNLYNKERSRMTTAFLNSGYADFYGNLISPLQVDTTSDITLVSLEVYLPPESEFHIKKYVGQVEVFTDYIPGEGAIKSRDTMVNGVVFHVPQEGPSVDYDVILDKIFLREDAVTRKIDIDNTYRGLSDLGVYKFITVTPREDSARQDIVNYSIQLTRSKKWVFDTGLDFNYSTLQSQGFGRNLIGISASALLKNRNAFNRAISLQLDGQIGAEVNVSQLDSFNTLSGTFEAVLNIPRFVGFPGTLKFLSLMKLGRRPILSPDFFDDVTNRAATQLRSRYQTVQVAAFYAFQQFDINYGYEIPIHSRKKYNIRTIGINYYRPDTLGRFDEITRGAEYFLRSFIGDRLFTGFLYRDFNFYYQSPNNEKGNYWIVNFSNEVSGLEVWAVNSLYNAFTNKTGNFQLKLDKEIDFARYTTFEFQYRYYWNLRGNTTLAFRFNPAVAFSFDDLNVPFVKQFYIGGPQSIRAWQIREVGPGTNRISEDIGDSGLPFFSSGDIKLELNLEYRFDLFWRLESAIFLDAGNIWLIDSDEPENNFSRDFYKQLAVGTGVGLRMDLTFAMLRLDMGYKIKTPYKNQDGNYWFHHSGNPFTLGNMLKEINFNLAIGYPF